MRKTTLILAVSSVAAVTFACGVSSFREDRRASQAAADAQPADATPEVATPVPAPAPEMPPSTPQANDPAAETFDRPVVATSFKVLDGQDPAECELEAHARHIGFWLDLDGLKFRACAADGTAMEFLANEATHVGLVTAKVPGTTKHETLLVTFNIDAQRNLTVTCTRRFGGNFAFNRVFAGYDGAPLEQAMLCKDDGEGRSPTMLDVTGSTAAKPVVKYLVPGEAPVAVKILSLANLAGF